MKVKKLSIEERVLKIQLIVFFLQKIILVVGGYNIANTARCYAYLTSIALGERIPDSIPENDVSSYFQ